MRSIQTPEQLKSLMESGGFASSMSRRFDLDDQSDLHKVAAQCVALHNAGQIDILRIIETGEVQALDDHWFFAASHFLCEVIPELVDSSARVMMAVDALVARGGQDGAATFPNAALRSWCAKDPSRALEIVAASSNDDPLAMRHLTFALEALGSAEEARKVARTFTDERRIHAVTALGRMSDQDAESIEKTYSVFADLIDASADDILCANMLTALAAILDRSKAAPSASATALMMRLLSHPGPATLHQAAQALWAHTKALNSEIVEVILNALVHLKSSNKGTVHQTDMGLRALLQCGFERQAIDFVAQPFGEGEGPDLGELKYFAAAMASGPPANLSRLVVRSLLLGSPRVCAGLAGAIRDDDLAGPVLNLVPSDLTDDLVLVARRAIGWFFFQPRTAASILVSILRVCDDATSTEVQQLLADPLLTNYDGVREYLSELSQDDPARKRVEPALLENETYLRSLNTVSSIKELAPSELQRRIERLRASDEMRTAHKQAQRQSVFLGMIKRSVLLYGGRSLTFVDDGEGPLRPVEINLSSFGVSMEYPRMDLVDPVGLQLILLRLKRGRISR